MNKISHLMKKIEVGGRKEYERKGEETEVVDKVIKMKKTQKTKKKKEKEEKR